MPELTVIFWRAIPAQVTAGKGRGAARVQLSDRFQEAIDAAAMRAGLIGTDDVPGAVAPRGAALRRRPRRRGGGCRSASSSTTTPTRGSSGSSARAEKRSPCDRDRPSLGHEGGRDRLRPPVRGHRRADQPDRPQAARRGDEGRQLRDGDRRRDRAGRGRRADARRQRRDPARRRAGDPAPRRSSSCSRSPTCRSRSTRRSSRRSRPGSPSTRASRSSTRSPARTSDWSACCRSSRSTAPRSSRSRTTRPASPRIPTCASRWPRKIVSRAADYGIPREDIVVDPLVMPIGAMGTAGRQVFRLVRRLQDELKVNSTCGASNVSFGLPNRPALNAAFLPMAIASGLTSAITSPLHPEVRQAIWAADVMNGNDEHCATLDRPQRRLGRGGADAAAAAAGDGRRRAAARVSAGVTTDHLVVFTPSGRRGRFAAGTTVLDAARRLGVDIDSVCGGRGICGRCQVEVSEGEFAKHGDHLRRRAPVADRRGRAGATPPTRASPPGRRLGCTAQRRGRSRHRRAAGEPGAPAGRAQGGRRAPDRDRSRRAALLRRGRRARHASTVRAISAGCARRSSASGS